LSRKFLAANCRTYSRNNVRNYDDDADDDDDDGKTSCCENNMLIAELQRQC